MFMAFKINGHLTTAFLNKTGSEYLSYVLPAVYAD
jgi:hypothetical protein